MADINSIKTDLTKEAEGVWVDFIEGIKLLIARSRNPKYMEMIRNLTEGKRVELRADKISTEDFAEILLQVRAHTVLLGWKNLQEDGVDVHYSPEKAMEYFRNPELKDFYAFVVGVSEHAEHYKKELVKESEKN